MKYTNLGKSDLKVSRICMGCMGFGDAAAGQHSWTVDESRTREIIKHGLGLGINFYDTAIAYQNGTSEQFVGKALRDFAKRDEYVIATKFTPRTQEEIDSGVSGQRHIENYLNKSLENLGMDYVDLYICHMWDYHTPMEEIMEGLNNAVKAGKARYIGISNCFAWQLAKANYYARSQGFAEFVSIQGHYNLIAREEEREMAPFCYSENIAMTPYSALASGRLSRHPGETSKRLEQDAYARFKYDDTAEADGKIIRRIEEIAEKGCFHDGGFPCVASDEGDSACGGCDKDFPCGWRGKSGGVGTDKSRDPLSGGAVCSPCPCGRYGTERQTKSRKCSINDRRIRQWRKLYRQQERCS